MSTNRRKRIIACEECHKKKVKCSGGGPPCVVCREAQTQCIYPIRDKKTKIGRKYLDSLIEENRRLAEIVSHGNTPTPTPAATDGGTLASTDGTIRPRGDHADLNPIISQQPWFVSLNGGELPIHIGEASDAAFATRLRQACSTRQASHMPRVAYMSDESLRGLTGRTCKWPGQSQLKYLVDVALRAVCERWHIVLRSKVLASVSQIAQYPDAAVDLFTECKVWALLAIGEAYSARCAVPDAAFPGAAYWAKAMALAHIAPERPCLDVVEIHLLLAAYASCMNRRHTAISLASSALRLCVILGLHLEVGEFPLNDPILREHRCRLWWTAYRFDRMWASKIGWPPSIPEEFIEVSLPSDGGLSSNSQSDFGAADYIIFATKLAGMMNSAINTLYVRKRHSTPFAERVQAAVRALKNWAEGLPAHLKLDSNDPPNEIGESLLYLHLAFNQAVIVITRPILLHLLKQRQIHLGPLHPSTATITPTVNNNAAAQTLSDSALSLATACVQRARHSFDLLRRSWTNGTFATFDYFDTQFLFSSATILALSAFLQGPRWREDREDFMLASSFLHQLECNGNFGAREFCTHVDAVKALLCEVLDVVPVESYNGGGGVGGGVDSISTWAGSFRFGGVGGSSGEAQQQRQQQQRQQNMPSIPSATDFLIGPDIDIENIDFGGDWINWQDVFLPDLQLQ